MSYLTTQYNGRLVRGSVLRQRLSAAADFSRYQEKHLTQKAFGILNLAPILGHFDSNLN
ncbi:MAG: hypothetical protein KME06_02805 [Kastovskya adunca ATA6-11-RM4]|jgi:hypothetical protein|nr:hypothetical protein [Kastovskya adunca ATA6-11-RM4]